MGNQAATKKENANSVGNKIFLHLRHRDIILHYPFKMKLDITDISLFPHGLQGLRLWDLDVILSRYVILQNQKFGSKNVFVFKGGVGITGVALSKWGGCKHIDMCDVKPQVVGNMVRNCERNGAKNVKCFEVNLAQFGKYTETYDFALTTDLISEGFPPQAILNIWRKVLKVGGESIMVMPEKKEEAKKFLQVVDRSEFKISNIVLTAAQYQSSPLLNKLQGEAEFPLIGKTNFYVISLTKLREPIVQPPKGQPKPVGQKDSNKQMQNQYKTPIKEDKQKQTKTQRIQQIVKEEKVQEKNQIIAQSNKSIGIPVTFIQQKAEINEESPIKKIQSQTNYQRGLSSNQAEKIEDKQMKEQAQDQAVKIQPAEPNHEKEANHESQSKQKVQNLQSNELNSQGI